MTDRHPSHRRDRDPAPDFEPGEALEQDLHALSPAPDLCRCIMARLGYMRQAKGPARRRRAGEWMRRATMVLAIAATMLAGVWVQQAGTRAAASATPTLPDAVRHDLQWNVRQINSAFETIRGRFTPLPPPHIQEPAIDSQAEPPGLDEIIERSARGPGSWA